MNKKLKSTLLDFVQKIKPGDQIEVWWVDASESYVKSLDRPLPNNVVETRKHEIGWYVGVQKGDAWRDIHLILRTESTDPDSPQAKHKITSLPFASKCPYCGEFVPTLPKRIVLLGEKEASLPIRQFQLNSFTQF